MELGPSVLWNWSTKMTALYVAEDSFFLRLKISFLRRKIYIIFHSSKNVGCPRILSADRFSNADFLKKSINWKGEDSEEMRSKTIKY